MIRDVSDHTYFNASIIKSPFNETNPSNRAAREDPDQPYGLIIASQGPQQ